MIRCLLMWAFNYRKVFRETSSFTWELLHAVRRAEVVLEGAVSVHGYVEVELRSKGEQGAGVVGVFDGTNTNTQQPVHVQHLLLDTDRETEWDETLKDTRKDPNTQVLRSWRNLGVDGSVDPGQSPAQMVQLLCKNLLTFLQLLQDVWSLEDRKHTHTHTRKDPFGLKKKPVRFLFYPLRVCCSCSWGPTPPIMFLFTLLVTLLSCMKLMRQAIVTSWQVYWLEHSQLYSTEQLRTKGNVFDLITRTNKHQQTAEDQNWAVTGLDLTSVKYELH